MVSLLKKLALLLLLAAPAFAQKPNYWTQITGIPELGPNPVYSTEVYNGYVGPNYNTSTNGTIGASSTALSLSAKLDFANSQGILVMGAGPATSLATPTNIVPTAVGVTGSSSYTYAVADMDFSGGITAVSAPATVTNAVSSLGVQSLSLSSCPRVSGVVTCTTSASHNFTTPTQFELPRGTASDVTFEGAFSTVSASGSTFAYTQYGLPDSTDTGGTVRAVGRVMLRWDFPSAGEYPMSHLIYRCNGSAAACPLPASASSFVLAGVATGLDSSFLDAGFTMFPTGVYNGVPATAPTSAVNQFLATTIASGGGTTALTLAAPATTAVSSAKTFHDNTPIMNHICGLINTQGTGGIVYIAGGATANFFPIRSPFFGCAVNAEIRIASPLWVSMPLVPAAGNLYKGVSGGNTSQTPPFYFLNPVGLLNGTAYPFFFFKVPQSSGVHLDSLLMQCSAAYQPCVLQDMVVDSSSVTSIRYSDVALQGSATSPVYIARGGFGFFWDRGGWSNAPTDFSALPAVTFGVNCGNGTSSNELPSIIFSKETYLFGLMLIDSCGVANLQNTFNNNSFEELLAENDYGPMVRVNGAGVAATDFYNPGYADYRGGGNTPMFDLTNANTAGVHFIHALCATATQATVETRAVPSAYQGLVFDNVSGGCAFTGAPTAIVRDGNSSIDTYLNALVAFSGGGRALSLMAAPAAPASAVVGSGGSVPVGTHSYQLTGVDYENGETTVGLPTTATTTTGNQTVTVTLPASFPTSAAGVNLYRDSSLINANGCAYPQFLTPGGTFVDTFSFTCGQSRPNFNTAGQTFLSSAQVAAPKLRVSGETFTAAPRAEQNIFLPGALTATWTGSTWTLDKAITVTRIQVQVKTAPVTCSPNAVVRLTDGSSAQNVTVTALGNDSGAISQNYAAGAALTVAVQTAAAGCGTSPSDANVIVQYRMQ